MIKIMILIVTVFHCVTPWSGCSISKINESNSLWLGLSVSDVSDIDFKLTCIQSNTKLNEEVTTNLK